MSNSHPNERNLSLSIQVAGFVCAALLGAAGCTSNTAQPNTQTAPLVVAPVQLPAVPQPVPNPVSEPAPVQQPAVPAAPGGATTAPRTQVIVEPPAPGDTIIVQQPRPQETIIVEQPTTPVNELDCAEALSFVTAYLAEAPRAGGKDDFGGCWFYDGFSLSHVGLDNTNPDLVIVGMDWNPEPAPTFQSNGSNNSTWVMGARLELSRSDPNYCVNLDRHEFCPEANTSVSVPEPPPVPAATAAADLPKAGKNCYWTNNAYNHDPGDGHTNIRSSQSSKSDDNIIGSIPANAGPFEYEICTATGWVRARYNGVFGWVHNSQPIW